MTTRMFLASHALTLFVLTWDPIAFVKHVYRLDAEVEETTLFREPRALGCRRPERQRGRY